MRGRNVRIKVAMKKIEYPKRGSKDFEKLLSEYQNIFSKDLLIMQDDWSDWKKSNCRTDFSETVQDLLTADVHKISEVYDYFISSRYSIRPRANELKKLDKIFDYKKYKDEIAKFFIERAAQLHISSCYYCETAYINVYHDEGTRKRQFDIDHYFPKERCPILALSLFNLIPSCQVCNSRIKHAKIIGNKKDDYERFNPAGENYSFDKNVSIRLRMKRDFTPGQNDSNGYSIYFHCKENFRKDVDFFHLEERYEFHKEEALRIKKLKTQYPPSAIKKIARMLGFSTATVTEDLFHERFLRENHRCFAKLTRDMLKTNDSYENNK